MRQNYKLPFFHPNHRQRNIILQLSIHYHGPMRSLSSGCFFVLPRIGRIGQIVSYGEKKRSKSLLLSLGLRPYSLMCMLSHVSELPCLNLPIRLVCPMADGKASKQNSCRRQYKMSLFRGYGQLPQTCQEPILRRTALQAEVLVELYTEGVAPGYYLVVPSRHRSAGGV